MTTVPHILLPVELGPGRVRYARGVRAGDWIFATGVLAQDFQNGIADAVLQPHRPLTGAPRYEREAALLFDHLTAVLEAGGAGLDRLVRLDPYYTENSAVASYQRIRNRRLGGRMPASTSVLVPELLLPEAAIEFHAIAHAGTPVAGPGHWVTVGDFVFLTGQFAAAQGDEPARDGIASAATVPPGSFWTGDPLRREAEFVIRQRIEPALARAESSLRQVVKAQVYLTDAQYIPTFIQVWTDAFGDELPATSIVTVPPGAIGLPAARLEINIVALRDDARTLKQVIEADVAPAYPGHPAAIRAGDLLFLSGLMANDARGLVAEARADPRQPYFSAPAEAQAAAILAKADRICAAAGTGLDRIVRIQQFHQDLGGFAVSHEAWRRQAGDRHLPFSALRVPGPSPIAGCGLLMDLWVHVPA